MSFDEASLVPNAGLLPAAALAQRLNLAGLVDAQLTVARHGANSGTKAVTVIGAGMAGGDRIDDTALLRAGARGALTVRADSAFYSRAVLGAANRLGVRF